MKYSVIIPVYMAEKTIKRCLDSIVKQLHENVEILLIDDGSTDNSEKICKYYSECYSCIKYFKKENGGVSSARNLGLNKATGEYVLFVDSDDYVADNYFEAIDSILQLEQPDMLMFAYQNVGGNNLSWNTGNYNVDSRAEIANKIAAAMRAYLFSALMAKTFKREIIEKYAIRFRTDISIGEDQSFIFQYAMHINKLVSVSDVLYFIVLENTNSLSRKRRDYLAKQLLEVSLDLFDCVVNSDFLENEKKVLYDSVSWSHYRSAYSSCMELLKYDHISNRKRRHQISEVCRMFTLRKMKSYSIMCFCIALPIKYRLSFLIDIIIQKKYKRKQSSLIAEENCF